MTETIHIIDKTHQPTFRPAMDYLINKRADQFPFQDDFNVLKQQAQVIRQQALVRLPELLEQAEKKLQQNGIVVHWAETIEEAQKIIHQLMVDNDADLMVKGKSMVSEEIHLNQYLQQQKIDALETDMGEFIVQLAGETPSHIIMPAIHKTKEDIAALFQKKLGVDYTLDVDELIQIGRNELRGAFEKSKVGLSGVNFIAADTGTLCLIENEGNGRLSTTAPDIHIAITGIEKVIAHLSDIPKLVRVLTRSATGQPITTYVNWINGPRKSGERDGPKEVHLVLLDNGRSELYQKKIQQLSLQCIRCGACMNHCPVYTRIGGHAYNTTYPGPIGKIISPHLKSLPKTPDHAKASALCGACNTVCPVGIPITQLLLDQRDLGEGRSAVEFVFWKVWSQLNRMPGVYNFISTMLLHIYKWVPVILVSWFMGGWTRHRKAPELSRKTLHELMKKRQSGGSDNS